MNRKYQHQHRCPHVLSQCGSCWFELRRLGRALKTPPWIFIVLFNFQSKHPCTNPVRQKCWALSLFYRSWNCDRKLQMTTKATRAEAWPHFSYIYCLQIHKWQIKTQKEPRETSNTVLNTLLQISFLYSSFLSWGLIFPPVKLS